MQVVLTIPRAPALSLRAFVRWQRLALLCLTAGACASAPATTSTRAAASVPPAVVTRTAGAGDSRVVLVTIDGARWQEVFRGAEPALLNASGARVDERTRGAFARPSADDARRALMPFVWGTIAVEGQLFGNVDRESSVRLANTAYKSYPGYHELLCGFASPVIVDNSKVPNPDPSVLEWLNHRPGFAGKVAAHVSWDVFEAILNPARSGLPVAMGDHAGLPAVVDRLRDEVTPPWEGSVYDAFVFHAAMQYLEAKQPRVLYLALGDVDEWAHAGRYDRYLASLHRADAWLAELWAKLQALPAYRGRTSLLVTTDHGRGDEITTWAKHGPDLPASGQTWVAVMGPDAAAAGERHDHPPVTLAQVAATVAALVGEDFAGAVPAAAAPLPLIRRR